MSAWNDSKSQLAAAIAEQTRAFDAWQWSKGTPTSSRLYDRYLLASQAREDAEERHRLAMSNNGMSRVTK